MGSAEELPRIVTPSLGVRNVNYGKGRKATTSDKVAENVPSVPSFSSFSPASPSLRPQLPPQLSRLLFDATGV